MGILRFVHEHSMPQEFVKARNIILVNDLQAIRVEP